MRLQSDPAPASRAPATFPRPDAREILATGSGSGSAGADFCLAPLLFGNWRGHGGGPGLVGALAGHSLTLPLLVMTALPVVAMVVLWR